MGKRKITPYPKTKQINITRKQFKNNLNDITQLLGNFNLENSKTTNKVKNRIKCLKSKKKKYMKIKLIEPIKESIVHLPDFENFPIQFEREYIDFFGKMYPKSITELEQMIDLVKVQYERIKTINKLNNHFQEMLYTLKRATLNFAKIINFFIYEESLIKTISLIEYIQKRETITSPYFNQELSYMNNQINSSLGKAYNKLVQILSNKKIQQRYLISLEKSLDCSKQDNKNSFLPLESENPLDWSQQENKNSFLPLESENPLDCSKQDFENFLNEQFKQLNID
jgi:hypothetical protein